MFTQPSFGLTLIVLIYVVVIAVLALVLYFVIRLAVLHALKAHSRWVEGGKQ